MTDSDSGLLSQEEIAQQFMLPERQAKVNQLIRAMVHVENAPPKPSVTVTSTTTDDEEARYCICRSTDSSRFMICCDHCEEWYHGDCIGVTKLDAKSIKQFFCSSCRETDPSLEIQYKKKKIKDKPPKSFRSSLSDGSDSDRYEKPHKPYKHKHHSKQKMTKEERVTARKKSSRRCGECTACHRTEDCARCDYCKAAASVGPDPAEVIKVLESTQGGKTCSTESTQETLLKNDMKKFGGGNRIRQKCRLRQCLNFGLVVTGQKWKHKPSEKDGSCTVTSVTESEHTEYTGNLSMDEDLEYENISHSSPRPAKRERRLSSSDSSPQKPRRVKKERTKHKRSTAKQKQKLKVKGHSTNRRRHSEFEEFSSHLTEEEEINQCHGPGCINRSRHGSRYCSDECGMKLAKNRLYELLPPKIQQWQSSPCLAEENNKKALERVRRQQLQARQKLGELDLKHQELDALIERAKHATISQPEQEGAEVEEDLELSIYCVTCGAEINQRGALKHMEKCFSKYEAQTSFGSIYKTRIEGSSMFCDFYNIVQKTYCKRLKVLCPEHSKDTKVGQDEVCGCPLVSNVFEESGEFCLASKRKCNKHFCWEKLRRAEIDMERVRQWLKLDELFEQERNIRLAMSNRMGVLGLMLHQSVDHDPLNPIKPPNN